MLYNKYLFLFLMSTILLTSCNESNVKQEEASSSSTEQSLVDKTYTNFKLESDLSGLADNQKEIIAILIEAAEQMNDLFWYEAYGDKDALLEGLSSASDIAFAEVNYGPWNRLDNNASFIDGIGEKPLGANFYPTDMTKEEFEAWDEPRKTSLYTFVRRDENNALSIVAYHEQFKEEVTKVSGLLKKAAALSENEAFKTYLNLRSEALLTDEYQASDMAWLDMKTNMIDIVIGPIENYEDHLFGYKAAHEAYVLVKDMEWSKRLAKYAQFLPDLQKGLPVPEAYKQEKPGSDTELNAYDVIYYAGDCNAGSKTIAINLPNDETVQLEKGTRRLQLKNAMKAKYEKILIPIADELIDPAQRNHISFDAFFANTMFHEVAHGLGIKNTIDGKGTVRESLKELSSALEEGKADMLGLYMVSQLHERGEIEGELMDYYVTFMAGIFRSVRFGASSAHGKANMIRFNYFDEMGAFEKDSETGKYKVNFDRMTAAMNALSELILTLQGDGNYEGVKNLVEEKGVIKVDLAADLERLSDAGIPIDIIFEQGKEVMGLE